MRSVILLTDYVPMPGGIANHYYSILKHLPQEMLTLVAPRMAGCEEYDREFRGEVRRRFLPVGRGALSRSVKPLLMAVYALAEVLWARGGVGRLHCTILFATGPAGLLVKTLLGVPYVVYLYGGETGKYQGGLSRYLMRRIIFSADYAVVNSEYTRDEYISIGVPAGKLRVVTPGVDTEAFRPGPGPADLLERYGLKGRRVILTVGRLIERKGHDTVIAAMPEVLSRFPDAVYLIVGDGLLNESLARQAETMGLSDRVVFAGHVPAGRLVDCYRMADLFVLANRETTGDEIVEGFGMVFIEANACGKAVVGGRSGGAVHAVRDGVTGLLVDPEDASAVAAAINTLLGDDTRRKSMEEAGLNRARSEFDWKVVATRMAELL